MKAGRFVMILVALTLHGCATLTPGQRKAVAIGGAVVAAGIVISAAHDKDKWPPKDNGGPYYCKLGGPCP